MGNKRVTAVVNDKEFEELSYWADKLGMSNNEYVRHALKVAIKRENKDYDLPDLEVARLNQLVDAMNVLSFNVANLEHIVTSGFQSLLSLTRGENYLLDDEYEIK
ncbi:MAG: hypothetical protein IJS80_02730 [Lachnospiraceae bacterium]|nr:hypothetical protein [Lachnospiraceae bacterium]